MRKLIVLTALILMISVSVSADNLEDLRNEQRDLQTRLPQYQQIIQNIQVRLVELNALINYLESKKVENETIREDNDIESEAPQD